MATPCTAAAKPSLAMASQDGLQVGKYQSKAMASKIPVSTVEKRWMKNLWITQPSKSILWERNQKVLRSLGVVEVVSTRSVAASMERKENMGTCRLGSILITRRSVMFPCTATKYVVQNQKAIQNRASLVLSG